MSFLTRILLVTLFVGSCVPQMAEDYILLTLESISARQDRLLQKFDEQETKSDLQQTMMQEVTRRLTSLEAHMNSTHEEIVSKLNSTPEELVSKLNSTHEELVSKLNSTHEELVSKLNSTHEERISKLNSTHEELVSKLNSIHEELVSKFCKEEQSTLTMTTHINEIKYANCKELLDSGVIQSGVYTITPEGFPDGVEVYCDQETAGGGWIVILRRQKQTRQVNFKKTFEEYASGFGDPNGELWIGNRVLHSMTGEEPFTLRVDAKNLDGESRTGIWQTFSVGSEDTEFTLSVADYSSRSTLGDGLWKPLGSRNSANNMKFSTIDRDNDMSLGSCSDYYGQGGGWWYNVCYAANPTAPLGDRNGKDSIANWANWESSSEASHIAISEIQFLIRP